MRKRRLIVIGSFWVFTTAVAAGSPGQDAPAPAGPKAGRTAAKDQDKPATTPKGKASAGSKDIQYIDLVAPEGDRKVELPYGRPFTIIGRTTQVCLKGTPRRDDTDPSGVSCGTGGQKLTDVIAPTTVGGSYIAAGSETPFTPSPISGDAWTVTVGKLDENTAVTFRFAFSGQLAATQSEAVIDELLASQDYIDSLVDTLKSASDHPEQSATLASAFGQKTAALVTALLNKRGVVPQNPADLGRLLFSPTANLFKYFFNIPSELQTIQGWQSKPDMKPFYDKLKLTPQMTPTAIYGQLKEDIDKDVLKADRESPDPNTKARADGVYRQIGTFVKSFGELRDALAAAVTANVSAQVGTAAFDVTEDLKKYAGVDGGALYVPRLHELPGFVTANIYWGSVGLHPERGTRNWAHERLSLMFGLAVKDLSSRDSNKTKMKDHNAFVYGIGFRLNKYFRLNTGGLMYRSKLSAVNGVESPVNDKLRHEFFIGPSIDITAIPALERIFAKKQSN